MGKKTKHKPSGAKEKNTEQDPKNTSEATLKWFIYAGVMCCFFLSGFAALLYQTAWMRQFSVVFGTSELAVATVLASYMAGLALGAALAARYIHQITRPVLFYGVLEAMIAVSALAVPYLLKLSGLFYTMLLGGQASPADASGLGQTFFYLLVAFIVIMIPTASMGATLPLLTKYVVKTKEQIGPRVGLLYAINTFGAIGGTLIAAFALLPAFGLMGTVWVGVGINLLVFIIAAKLAQSISRQEPTSDKTPVAKPVSTLRLDFKSINTSWILPIMLLSGANAFTYEVLWTRLLSHVLGGSIAAFATMLASFLGGIALGSAIASRFSKSWQVSFYGFGITQVGIAITSMCIYQFFYLTIPETPGLTENIALPIIILLPATLFIGATFPFAVRLLALDETVAAESSARVYSWNTLGAIVGAVAAGFYLIPLLRYEGAIKMAVLINLCLALLTFLLLQKQRYRSVTVTVLSLLLVVFLYKPVWPEAILRISPIMDSREGEVVYYDVGRSSTVLLLERDGYYYVRNNGLSEASIDLRGSPPAKHSQRLLTTLPIIARPESKELLVVGFGGGVALENINDELEVIDVIELEPKVIEANSKVSDTRGFDPLSDPRVNIYINDARSALQLTEKQYDIIVSQPSHPWTAGASHLYTREFMQLSEKHLKESGVFLQWMNINFINRQLFKALCRTMLEVFPHVRVYEWEPNVLFFIGSNSPLSIEQNIALTGLPFKKDRDHFMQKGIASMEDVVSGLMMDEEGIRRFAKGAPVITDNFNLMATGARMKLGTTDGLSRRDIANIFAEYSPLFNSDSWIYHDLATDLNFYYIGERYRFHGTPLLTNELTKVLHEMEHPAAFLLAGSFLLRNNQFNKGREALINALEVNPDDQQARYMLLRLYADQLADGTAPQMIKDHYELLPTSAKAVIDLIPLTKQGEDANTAMEFDTVLAEGTPMDPWYLDAVKLRANWRIRHPDEAQRKVHAQEAMDFIDDAISIYQDLDFYGMRMAASYLSGQTSAVVETARRMIWVMRQSSSSAIKRNQPLPMLTIRNNLNRINSISAGLSDLIKNGEIEEYKLEDIRLQIEALLNEYSGMAREQGASINNIDQSANL